MNKALSAASVALLLFSCKPDVDVPAPVKGSVDASKYIAIGSSMSAGYADNALYQQAQLTAYPNLVAQQLKMIGGGEFKQPLVDAASVGVGAMQNARYVLMPDADCAGVTSLAPMPAAPMGDLGIFMSSVAAQGPFNNISVPGMKSITTVYPGYGDFNNGPGNYNPFFTRMASNMETSSILSDAAMQAPTFFSLAIGQDDVMAYALTGGTQDAVTPASGPAGFGFDGSMDAIVNTLTAGNAKGVIMNIPELSHLPFFTTVPYNGLMLDAANAAGLSAAYAPLGISFQAGANGFMIEDANAPGGMRKANQGEMILLTVPQDSLKCAGWGSMKPIPNQFVLTSTELDQINTAIAAYNNTLSAIATAKGLAFVDVNGFMSNAKSGIMYNGVAMNAQFVTGGIFSLDGINLTPRGNALLANEIIRKINAKYGSTIPQLDATRYKGIVFP
jgi:lysophospholipase L1-like esterase